MNTKYLNCIKTICKEYSVEFDLVDIQEFDSSLEYYEFKEEVINFVSNLVDTTTVNANKLTREDLYQIEENRLTLLRNQIEQQLKLTKYDTDYFYNLKQYVSAVAKKHTNNLIVTGVGGIGKSYQITKTIKELGLKENDDYVSINGYMTPLKLYEIVYENQDKLIIFDDIEGILSNKISIAILKGLLWDTGNNKRMVTYNSTTSQLQYPSMFEFTGQVIIISNKIDKANDVHTKALLSRAIHYNLEFALDDIKEILKQISTVMPYKNINLETRLQITTYITDNSDNTTKDLNIRGLIKAFDIYLYANSEHIDWQPLVLELFNKDENLIAIKEILNEYSKRKDQIKAYIELTGQSRRQFYYALKKI